MEVHDTSIVVILAREESFVKLGGVNVGQWVVVGIPASEAEVEPANSCEVVIHRHHLLVMRPELDTIWEGVSVC